MVKRGRKQGLLFREKAAKSFCLFWLRLFRRGSAPAGACLFGIVLSALAIAGDRPLLPSGTYAISGIVQQTAGQGCIFATKSTIAGHLDYSGAGAEGTVFFVKATMETGTAMEQFVALPPVPAAGLNGWSSATPADAAASEYVNEVFRRHVTMVRISFMLTGQTAGDEARAQGSIIVSDTEGCTASLTAKLLRDGSYIAVGS